MSPRPFTVDAAVMAAIRPMTPADTADVARLHHAAMGSSTWAQLGQRFLRTLYTALLADERFGLAECFDRAGLVVMLSRLRASALEMLVN